MANPLQTPGQLHKLPGCLEVPKLMCLGLLEPLGVPESWPGQPRMRLQGLGLRV